MSLNEHSVLQIIGEENKRIEFDIDPSKESIKMTVGTQTVKFKFRDLFGIVFAAADPEQQDKMMPTKHTEMVTYKRIHRIRLKKDLKAGQELKCHCEINVEKTVVEGLKGLVDPATKHVPQGVPLIGV